MSTRQLQKWACPRRILLATNLVDLGFILPVTIQQALAYKATARHIPCIDAEHVRHRQAARLPLPDFYRFCFVLPFRCHARRYGVQWPQRPYSGSGETSPRVWTAWLASTSYLLFRGVGLLGSNDFAVGIHRHDISLLPVPMLPFRPADLASHNAFSPD